MRWELFTGTRGPGRICEARAANGRTYTVERFNYQGMGRSRQGYRLMRDGVRLGGDFHEVMSARLAGAQDAGETIENDPHTGRYRVVECRPEGQAVEVDRAGLCEILAGKPVKEMTTDERQASVGQLHRIWAHRGGRVIVPGRGLVTVEELPA